MSNSRTDTILDSVLGAIGNTPLVEIRRIFSSDRIRILAKLEWFNPGGSVKDRAAYSMIRRGEETGELYPGKTIVDATSGNTGIAYAMIAAARDYRLLLAMPANASVERKQILRAYGAELLLTDPLEGSDGAICAIRELYAKSPEKYFYPDQYSNDANWQAHYHSTAMEISSSLSVASKSKNATATPLRTRPIHSVWSATGPDCVSSLAAGTGERVGT